jgi:hypothetical protein
VEAVAKAKNGGKLPTDLWCPGHRTLENADSRLGNSSPASAASIYLTSPSSKCSPSPQFRNRQRILTLADLVKNIVTESPSRTLVYAATDLTRNLLGDDGPAEFGSGDEALTLADRALYSKRRPAHDRIHWMFSPLKDERVSSLLDWIQFMSFGLGTLGVSKPF